MLGEVLAAREARAGRQAALLARLGLPLVSMTLVSPGPVKDGPGRRLLMDRAETLLASRLASRGFAIRSRERLDGPAGPWALFAVEAEPQALKALAVGLEEAAPWCRLLDADVVVAADSPLAGFPPLPRPIARGELGLPGRPCLLCGREAALCMAERRHPGAELAAAAERLLDLVP